MVSHMGRGRHWGHDLETGGCMVVVGGYSEQRVGRNLTHDVQKRAQASFGYCGPPTPMTPAHHPREGRPRRRVHPSPLGSIPKQSKGLRCQLRERMDKNRRKNNASHRSAASLPWGSLL